MSVLQMQIIQSIIKMPEDKLELVFDNIQQLMHSASEDNIAKSSTSDPTMQSGGIKIGLFDGMKYIADGHDIDECNDEIAALFGVN